MSEDASMTAAAVEALLDRPQPGGIHCRGAVDSTMTVCRGLAEAGAPEGAVVLADAQTAGVGRMGRPFASPAGQGVYLSMVLRPRSGRGVQWLTSLAGLAVCRALEELCGPGPRLKWPNDVILQGRKICGILVQTSLGAGGVDYGILGAGVNVGQTSFGGELADKAVSLKMAGWDVPRPRVAAALIRHLNALLVDRHVYEEMPAELIRELKDRSCTLGQEVLLVDRDGETPGLAVDLDPGGGLVVQTARDRRVITSGEVSVRGLLGYLPGAKP